MTTTRNWRRSSKYRRWRKAVLKRDRHCQICKSTQKLHAHHVESAFYNVDLRFKVGNGITFCSGCHVNFHTNFKRSYRIKTTLYDLKNFKTLARYFKRVL